MDSNAPIHLPASPYVSGTILAYNAANFILLLFFSPLLIAVLISLNLFL